MKRLCVLSGKQAFWEKQIATDPVLHQGLKDFSQGHYVSSDLKRLKQAKYRGHPTYRLKLNNKARVLLSFLPPNNQPTLLGYIPKHRYERNSILNGGEQKSSHMDDVFLEEFDLDDVEEVHKDEIDVLLTGTAAFDGEYGNVVPCGNAWVTLDGVQEKSFSLKKPGLFEGVPGAGKTLLGLAALSAELHSLLEREQLGEADPNEKICYVAHSASLCNQVKEQWRQYGYPKKWNQRVEFVTVEALLAKQFPHLSMVGKDHFSDWYKRYEKRKATDRDWVKLPYDAKHIEKELPVCEVYPRETYCTLGMDRSHVDKSFREQTYQISEEYKRHLKNTKCHNEWLYPSLKGKKPVYGFTFVDEYQDLNYSQLRFLTELTRRGNILYSGDKEQNIKSNYRAQSYLHNLHNGKLSVLELPKSYRLPTKIANIANIAKTLKKILNGGTVKGATTDVKEVDENNSMGHAYFIPLEKIGVCNYFNQEKGIDFAVVIPSEDYREEAAKIFGTDLIYTAETIKGLQYRTVVAYKCLDQAFFEEAERSLRGKGLKVPVNQPKQKQAESRFDKPCDTLYTILSRTTENLILCDEKTVANSLFLDPYLAKYDPGLPPDDLLAKSLTSVLDWQNHAYKLWLEGENGQNMATMIYKKKLGWTPFQWQEFLASLSDVEDSNSLATFKESPHTPYACDQVTAGKGLGVLDEKHDGGEDQQPLVFAKKVQTMQKEVVVNKRGKKKKQAAVIMAKKNFAEDKQHKEKLRQAFFKEASSPVVVSQKQKKLSQNQIIGIASVLDGKFTTYAVTRALQRCNSVEEIEAIFLQSQKRADGSEFVLLSNSEAHEANNKIFIHAIMGSTELLCGLNLQSLPNLGVAPCSMADLRDYQKQFNKYQSNSSGVQPADPILAAIRNNWTQVLARAIAMGFYTDKDIPVLFAKTIYHPDMMQEIFVGFRISRVSSLLVRETEDQQSLPLLHFAAAKDAIETLLYLTVDLGMDPKQQFEGETLIHHAIRRGKYRTLRWAIKSYPDLLDIGNPLQFLVQDGDIECLKSLLESATSEFIQREGVNAYALAVNEGKKEISNLLKDTLRQHQVIVTDKASSSNEAQKRKWSEDVLASEESFHKFMKDNPKGLKQLVQCFSVRKKDIYNLVIRSKKNLMLFSEMAGPQYLEQLVEIFSDEDGGVNSHLNKMLQGSKIKKQAFDLEKGEALSPTFFILNEGNEDQGEVKMLSKTQQKHLNLPCENSSLDVKQDSSHRPQFFKVENEQPYVVSVYSCD